jgi:hypothetical protein
MVDVLSLLGAGLAGSAITWVVNWQLRKREEALEIIKIISKSAPLYNLLARNAWSVSWELVNSKNKKADYKLLMYYICNVLNARDKISRTFGDMQFDNLRAERVINTIGGDIFSALRTVFGPVMYSRLTHLVEYDLPYHKFHEIISCDKELYEKFEKWLSTEISEEERNTLERNCAWYAQLIMLELNHLYKIWYSEEPPLIAREDLRNYLSENENDYYNRIMNFTRHARSEMS